MTRTTIVVPAALVLAVSAVIGIAPAQAQNGTLTRSFVSSAGIDSNPCTITQPCATFAHAYTAIGANGIIAALDPGKYGPLTITGPVTINGNGWAAITGPSGSSAITINAGSGNVTLTGLEIDGAGTSSSGIVLNFGGNLNVRDCVIQNFQDSGIDIVPNVANAFSVSNTLVSGNGLGIHILPSGSGTTLGILDHVEMQNNTSAGLEVISEGQTINVTVSDSVIANNTNGIIAILFTGPVNVMVRNTTIANNVSAVADNGYGLAVNNTGATVWVTRSTITGNTIGWFPGFGGTVTSYGDNNVMGNGTDGAPTSTLGTLGGYQ
jgi:hypothetical protein